MQKKINNHHFYSKTYYKRRYIFAFMFFCDIVLRVQVFFNTFSETGRCCR